MKTPFHHFTISSLFKFVFFLSIMAAPVLAFSQQVPELVNTFTASPTNLTSIQQSRWQIIDGFEATDTLYAFPTIDFSQIGQDGRFKMNLPGGCQNVGFKTARAESHANGDFNFIAYVEERDTCLCNCNFGDFTYVKKDGISVGLIRVDHQAYEIKDLKEGKLCLRSIDIGETGCVSGSNEEEFAGHGDEDIAFRNECCPVRIMILHDAAANVLGDIAARATMDIFLTNEALRNSRISPCNLRLALGTIHEYNIQDPDPNNAREDVERVKNDNQNLRTQQSADIVVFYTGLDYSQGDQAIGGIALGLANPGSNTDPEEDAYALVEATAQTTAIFTFAHEVAHLFQCRHEQADDPIGLYQHAHSMRHSCGLFCSRIALTMMYTLPTEDEPRVLHFSNPYVKYRRKATGVEDFRDNARQLRNMACTVSEFRLAGDPLMASVAGPSTVCLNSSVQFFSEIGGDAPDPFTYIWETASSILGPYQIVSTDPSVTLYGSGIVGQITYIRLTITSSDNQVAEAFHILECTAPAGISCEQFFVEEEAPNLLAALPGIHWSVFPNPASSEIELILSLEQSCDILKVDLLDSNGRLLDNIILNQLESGNYKTRFNLLNYIPGIYLLRITTPNGTKGKTIVRH